MLLYRPLLAAYRQTTVASARRFLLREFADPQLHAEPDELLRELDRNKDVGLLDEPARLGAEIALRERLLKLRLTTRDPVRAMGGMWTMHSGTKTLGNWVRSEVSIARLGLAAGEWIGRPGEALSRVVPGDERARVLCSLGDVGAAVAFDTLREELTSGPMPAAAAVGLSHLPGEEGHAALLPAVQARGLTQSAGWLGLALSRMPSHTTTPLLTRLANSEDRNLREQAAVAVGAFAKQGPAELLGMFKSEKDAFVRLHLLGSIGRLHVPGGTATLRRFSKAGDPVMLKTAAIKAAGLAAESEARPFLEEALKSKEPEEVAEALQSLVALGVNGEPYLPVAREASNSRHGRLMLVGLLALAIWKPDEAFARIRETFTGPPSSQWFLAAYVLRYLRTDQTVSLLTRLCTAAHGSDLEEIAVSSLSRYLDDPAAITALFALANAGTTPLVLHRMMTDIARHLPPNRAAEVAAQLRGMLKPDMDPAAAGPMLVALGSLGTPEDIATLTGFLKTPAAVSAIHGLELINETSCADALSELARGPATPASEAAVVALFRLGDKVAAEHFERLASAEDDAPAASRCFLDMAMSVRCIKETSRLSRLYDALSEVAKNVPEPEAAPEAAPAPVVEGGEPGDVDLVTEAMRAAEEAAAPKKDLEAVLNTRRKTVRGLKPLALNQAAPSGSGSAVYRDLGKHLKEMDPEEEARAKLQKRVLVGLLALLVGISAFAGWRHHEAQVFAPDAAEAARLAGLPPMYRAGSDPDAGAFAVPDTLTGARSEAARLINRIPANQLATTGKLKIEKVTFPDRLPLECRLEGVLLEGSVEIDWPRGTARITVEGARTTVDIAHGHVRLDKKESTFLLYAISGTVKTLRNTIVMKTLEPGQGGEFLDGNPAGRIEELAPPPSLLPAPSPVNH